MSRISRNLGVEAASLPQPILQKSYTERKDDNTRRQEEFLITHKLKSEGSVLTKLLVDWTKITITWKDQRT